MAKSVNTPLPDYIAHNIRSAHVDFGKGTASKPTETRDRYREDK